MGMAFTTAPRAIERRERLGMVKASGEGQTALCLWQSQEPAVNLEPQTLKCGTFSNLPIFYCAFPAAG